MDLQPWKEDLSRLFLTSLLSIAPDAIITVDDQHYITVFNEGAESILGYRRHEVLGQPLDLLLPERFRGAHTEHIREFGTDPQTARLMS